MASTECHKARGDEVVEVAAPAALDTLFAVVKTWWEHTREQKVSDKDT